MKTNRLILKNGLFTLLVMVSVSLNCLASAAANEITASPGAAKSDEAIGLIDPITASGEDVFTETLKNWMESGLYWASFSKAESENRETSDEMLQTKVTTENPTFFSGETDLLNSLKNWMQNGFYWDKTDE